jgi:hypothetical protein
MRGINEGPHLSPEFNRTTEPALKATEGPRPPIDIAPDLLEVTTSESKAPIPMNVPGISHKGSISKQLESLHDYLNILSGKPSELQKSDFSAYVNGLKPEDINQSLLRTKKLADKLHGNRGLLSKLRDALSFAFGKSDATKAHDNFMQAHGELTQIHEKLTRAQDVLSLANRILNNPYINEKNKKAIQEIASDPDAAKSLIEFLNTAEQVSKDKPADADKRESQLMTSFGTFMDKMGNSYSEKKLSEASYRALISFTQPFLEKFKMQNSQFNTDSLQTLFVSKGSEEAKENKTGRFYQNLQNTQLLREGRLPEGSEDPLPSPELIQKLNTQTEIAEKAAQDAGLGKTQWFTTREVGVGLLTHAGWTNESLPTKEKPALFKAERTLGMAQGDKAQVGKVSLDFSPLKEITREQASILMATVQSVAEHYEDMKKDKIPNAEFLNTQVVKLKEFTPEQQTLIAPIIKKFVEDSAAKINELHSKLNQ